MQAQLKNFSFKITKHQYQLVNVAIYNPDKWQYTSYTFFKKKPTNQQKNISNFIPIKRDSISDLLKIF